MKVYFDSSALLRRYFKEKESEDVARRLQEPHTRLVCGLVFVELASVFRRALKGRKITKNEHRTLSETAKSDLRHFRVLTSSEEMFRQAALIADITGLKSLDSIHLASARMAGVDRIVTYDKEMAAAAGVIGIKTWE